MKQKGRFVVEAAYLVPFLCLLLVYLFFFTLYAHDYAVCSHTALETGVRGVYRDGRGDRQIEEEVKKEAAQKLAGRLLWLGEPQIEVTVNPVQLCIKIAGTGDFLPVDGIEIEQKIHRVQPCESIRRSRWMKN